MSKMRKIRKMIKNENETELEDSEEESSAKEEA